MTVLPLPDPAALITDEIVEAAIASYGQVLRNVPVALLTEEAQERLIARRVLEDVALMIVAAWQHAEEVAP